MSEERLVELRRIANESVKVKTHVGWFPTGHAWELLDEIDRLRAQAETVHELITDEDKMEIEALLKDMKAGVPFEKTQHYLSLLEENIALRSRVDKLHDQRHEEARKADENRAEVLRLQARVEQLLAANTEVIDRLRAENAERVQYAEALENELLEAGERE